jgi:hypothetical protein
VLTVTHKMDFYIYGIRNWLVDSLSARRPRFKPDILYMSFVVYKASLRKGFLRVLRYTVVHIIPPMLHKNLNLHVHSQKATRVKLKNPGIKFVLLKPGAFVKEKYFQRLVLQTCKADYVFTRLLINVLYTITSQIERPFCQYSPHDLPHSGPVALLLRILEISST